MKQMLGLLAVAIGVMLAAPTWSTANTAGGLPFTHSVSAAGYFPVGDFSKMSSPGVGVGWQTHSRMPDMPVSVMMSVEFVRFMPKTELSIETQTSAVPIMAGPALHFGAVAVSIPVGIHFTSMRVTALRQTEKASERSVAVAPQITLRQQNVAVAFRYVRAGGEVEYFGLQASLSGRQAPR